MALSEGHRKQGTHALVVGWSAIRKLSKGPAESGNITSGLAVIRRGTANRLRSTPHLRIVDNTVRMSEDRTPLARFGHSMSKGNKEWLSGGHSFCFFR